MIQLNHLVGTPIWLIAMLAGLRTDLAAQVACRVLRTSDSSYAGRCERKGKTVALLVLRPPGKLTDGRWLGTQARILGPGGDTSDVVDWSAFAPAFVDVGRADSIFSWCWCRVVRANVDSVALEFEADPARPAPVNADDLAILERVRAFFTDSTKWDRHSDRNRAIPYCPRVAASRTLFCALYEATVATRGDFFDGAAGGAIRASIQATSPRQYQHPLDGFNNDPLVDLATFQRMLDGAIRRVRSALSPNGRGA